VDETEVICCKLIMARRYTPTRLGPVELPFDQIPGATTCKAGPLTEAPARDTQKGFPAHSERSRGPGGFENLQRKICPPEGSVFPYCLCFREFRTFFLLFCFSGAFVASERTCVAGSLPCVIVCFKTAMSNERGGPYPTLNFASLDDIS
jgi:hypothetical protein